MEKLEQLTLRALLKRSLQLYPDRIALSEVDGLPITYESFGGLVRNLAQSLRDRGIAPGDRVAILSENKPNWGIAFFAVTTIGAVAVPILPDFHSAEVHHILRHSSAKALFISEHLFEKIEGEHFDDLKTIVLIETLREIPLRTSPSRLKELIEEGKREFAKLREAALRAVGRIPPEVREEDIASIIYTSGTTGHSKGVMLTHKNIVFDAMGATKMVNVSCEDRLLSILPLSHAYECTIGLVIPVMRGASVYYLNKRPTAQILLPAMAKVKPTILLSVPLVVEKIYKAGIVPKLTKNAVLRGLLKFPLTRKVLHKKAGKKLMESFGGHLRVLAIGGASLAPDVEKFLREAGVPYAIGYGLTETSPLVAGSDPSQTRYRSTGYALTGTEIMIDNPHPGTGGGEILVRGPVVMKGYYRDERRTEEVMTKEGWFRTGDLGVLTKDGYLYVKGRLKNVIVGASGENIYPEEIESILNEFDLVLESLVFEQQGQLVARVHLDYEKLDQELRIGTREDEEVREGVRKILDDLRRKANERVSSFSRINRIIEQTEPFEKTATQKIKRYLYV